MTIDVLRQAGLFGAKLSRADLKVILAGKGIDASDETIAWLIGHQIPARGYRLRRHQPDRRWLPNRYWIKSVPPTHWLTDKTRHIKRRQISWHERIDAEIGPQYYPAISGVSLQALVDLYRGRQPNWHCLRKDPRIFTPKVDAYFRYDRVLVSAPIADRRKLEFTLKDLFANPDLKIFVDSGGYQIQTGQIKRDEWTDAMALDYSLRNGTIFPILDSPVLLNSDFKRNLAETDRSAQYYRNNRPNAGETILNTAHGRDLDEIKRWVEIMSKVELDGWGLGSLSNRNPKQLLKAAFYMLRSGLLDNAKVFHVFGMSKLRTVLYLTIFLEYVRRYRPDLKFDISYDSSYPLRTAIFANGAVSIRLAKSSDLSRLPDKDFMLCDCPVCQNTETNYKRLIEANELQLFFALHNTYRLIRHQKSIAQLVHLSAGVDGLELYQFPKQDAVNIGIIREAFENMALSETIIDSLSL